MAALNSTCFAAAFFTPRDYRLPSRQTTITLHLHQNCGRTPKRTLLAADHHLAIAGVSGRKTDSGVAEALTPCGARKAVRKRQTCMARRSAGMPCGLPSHQA